MTMSIKVKNIDPIRVKEKLKDSDCDCELLCREFALKVKRMTDLPINVSKLESDFDNAIGNAIARVKEERSREYHNHMHCQDGKGQL